MEIQAISFGARSILKTEFLNGNIKLKKDITGRNINKENASLDHTVPKSKGGKSDLYNYSIMDREINMIRGNGKLDKFIDIKSLLDYIIVMLDYDKEFSGIEYIKKWLRNLRKEV